MPDGRVLFRTHPHQIVLIGYILLALVFQFALFLIAAQVPRVVVILGPAFVLTILALDYFATVYEATTDVKIQGGVEIRGGVKIGN